MASERDEGLVFVDQATEIEDLAKAGRESGMLELKEKLALDLARLMLLSLNRMANALSGIELTYAAIADHFLPDPKPLPLEGEEET